MATPIEPSKPTQDDWPEWVNRIVDSTLIALFSIELVLHIWLDIQYQVKNKTSRTMYNQILAVFVFLCLAAHLSCLMYSVTGDADIGIPPISATYYTYYQLTFDLLNIALIAHIF